MASIEKRMLANGNIYFYVKMNQGGIQYHSKRFEDFESAEKYAYQIDPDHGKRKIPKPFTLDELIKIEQLLKENLSLQEIARQINRASNSIIVCVKRNGGRDKFNGADTFKRNTEARKRMNSFRPLRKQTKLEKAVKGLQQQIDILMETIMSLQEKIK